MLVVQGAAADLMGALLGDVSDLKDRFHRAENSLGPLLCNCPDDDYDSAGTFCTTFCHGRRTTEGAWTTAWRCRPFTDDERAAAAAFARDYALVLEAAAKGPLDASVDVGSVMGQPRETWGHPDRGTGPLNSSPLNGHPDWTLFHTTVLRLYQAAWK